MMRENEGLPMMSKEAAFHEMKVNPPKQLAKTAKKFGKADANRQRIAIALSKSGASRRTK